MVFNSPCLTDKKELIHHEGTALECGASESAGVYVSSLHSQHHAHMCFCCFLMLVKCFAAVPISIPSGRTFIVPAGRRGQEEDEFEEEEYPQEDEDDMEIDIEEDENEPELTYPYEEVDPLNPPSPAFDFEPDDEIEVENPIKHDDETVPVSVYEVGELSTAAILREDGDRLLPGFMRWDIDSLFVCSSVDQGMAAIERLVEKLGNVKEKAESHEFYQEMIRKGFVFEERPDEAIDVSIEDVKSSSPKDS
ncbi:hypothetical protein Tco_1190097 [Tanacetum coccineum]